MKFFDRNGDQIFFGDRVLTEFGYYYSVVLLVRSNSKPEMWLEGEDDSLMEKLNKEIASQLKIENSERRKHGKTGISTM